LNYRAHYDRLIDRARNRASPACRERHHVIPKCMGGDNSPANIVALTPEEHYVAHQLLVKMYALREATGISFVGRLRKPYQVRICGTRLGQYATHAEADRARVEFIHARLRQMGAT
jgi:hypothetical protein